MIRTLKPTVTLFAIASLIGGLSFAQDGHDHSSHDHGPKAVDGVSLWLNAGEKDAKNTVPASSTPKQGSNPAWGKDGAIDFSKLKGKVVVVEFWATWCPPCKKSVPHLNALYKKNKERGLLIVGLTAVDRNQNAEKIARYTKQNIKYPVGVLGSMDTLRRYEVSGIPHAVVIGRDGKVKWTGNPLSPAFDTAVNTQLDKKLTD